MGALATAVGFWRVGGCWAGSFSAVDGEAGGLLEGHGDVVSAGSGGGGEQRGDASEFGQRAGLVVRWGRGVVSFAAGGGDRS